LWGHKTIEYRFKKDKKHNAMFQLANSNECKPLKHVRFDEAFCERRWVAHEVKLKLVPGPIRVTAMINGELIHRVKSNPNVVEHFQIVIGPRVHMTSHADYVLPPAFHALQLAQARTQFEEIGPRPMNEFVQPVDTTSSSAVAASSSSSSSPAPKGKSKSKSRSKRHKKHKHKHRHSRMVKKLAENFAGLISSMSNDSDSDVDSDQPRKLHHKKKRRPEKSEQVPTNSKSDSQNHQVTGVTEINPLSRRATETDIVAEVDFFERIADDCHEPKSKSRARKLNLNQFCGPDTTSEFNLCCPWSIEMTNKKKHEVSKRRMTQSAEWLAWRSWEHSPSEKWFILTSAHTYYFASRQTSMKSELENMAEWVDVSDEVLSTTATLLAKMQNPNQNHREQEQEQE
jgi:hypothetical protein